MPISAEKSNISAPPSDLAEVIFHPNTRLYTTAPSTCARKPWNAIQSKIHSVWGDLREKVGLTSEVRKIRNSLPQLIQNTDKARLNIFLEHLEKTGEFTLREAIYKHVGNIEAARNNDAAELDTSHRAKQAFSNLQTKCTRIFLDIRQNCNQAPVVATLKLEYLQLVADCISTSAGQGLLGDHEVTARNYINDLLENNCPHLNAEQQQFVMALKASLMPSRA